MIDDRSEPTNDPLPTARSFEDQRRLLELQLLKIRNEASAARLEARAAEIELMIRQLGAEGSSPPKSSSTQSGTPINSPHIPLDATESASHGFHSWDEVRLVYAGTAAPADSVAAPAPTILKRFDAAETRVKHPRFLDADDNDPAVASDSDAGSETETDQADQIEPSSPLPVIVSAPSRSSSFLVKGEISIDSEPEHEEEAAKRRRKPAAWLVSAISHVAVLAVLAAITLRTQRPQDQVALSASAAEANPVSMQTFTIESSEPAPETSQPMPSETEYELSPVGQMAATDFAPKMPPAPAAAAMTGSRLASAAAMSLKSDSDAQIEFCGVEGGGNHFVYLIDSSGSMGDAFVSARAEVLASVGALKQNQRFYVVFFDAESDYMRLSNPSRDEPRSANASPENQAALKRWAMRIAMDRGRAPYDALRFALKLRPDVIFLLSDGEFPQGIEDLLREENKVENLFGDSHPISIVHTIGYHSKEGESRMRRIAEQNRGQYRYIPKP
jgi:hypothetical protein